ncbi:hypothetical protein [Archangium lipolyticum]|uniref:hypothetical protein n=1 Tax=Archangium lipolyticum TaxID=2970465 RepID=UPI002149C006|nr:hypothetical protein [Archangium lipolyticum]
MTEETEVRSQEPRAVSLDLELSTLASATRGAEILADYQTRKGFMDDETEANAPVCILSILSLVRGRFEQVRRVIRGEEDPEHIWGPHNAITLPESLDDVDGDIVLFPWSARGMPLVLARPSAWGVEAKERKERKERKAMILEERMARNGRGSKRRKAREPAPESPSAQGEESKEPPPAAP